RVDHPDGLTDPRGYLDMLAELSADRYTLVEKILEPGEELPREWRCAGTTGYDALALIDRDLVDPAGEPVLTALDADLRAAGGSPQGHVIDWPDLVHGTKRAVADGILGSEARRLVRLLPPSADGEAAGPRRIDAVAELLANFSVYRTYE